MGKIFIPNDHYGPGTVGMQKIIDESNRIRWFFPEADSTIKANAPKLIGKHLELLRHQLGTAVPLTTELRWLEGEMALLHQNRWDIDPYNPWGNRWETSRRILAEMTINMIETIEQSPYYLSLAGPPLWPSKGRLNVVDFFLGQAGSAIESDIFREYPELICQAPDHTAARGLLIQANDDIWGALLWEFLTEVKLTPNPFQPLLDLYKIGCFPMGWEDSQHYIFRYLK